MPGAIPFESKVHLAYPPERVWPLVADTDRVDRAIGLPLPHYTRRRRPEGGEDTVGTYQKFGIPYARWTEHPFTWEAPRRFAALFPRAESIRIRRIDSADAKNAPRPANCWSSTGRRYAP